eukprot:296035_1
MYTTANVWKFTIPIDIMRKKGARNIKDIAMCLKKNNVPKQAIDRFILFCRTEKYKFVDLETNLIHVRNKFQQKHADLIHSLFIDCIEKCIYELSSPVFTPTTITKNDIKVKYDYFEKQCKGIIKYDVDLLAFFCITENTERGLPSQLVDIFDRIMIIEKQQLDVTRFGVNHTKHCDQIQVSKVQQGLRKYHNKFFPVFPKNPFRLIADKISGYQKYCILLSHVITEIEKQIIGYNQLKDNKLLIPYMIDMMILPPGCFNKIEDANSKTYDCSGPEHIGNIQKRLKDFNILVMETHGLTDKTNNFDLNIIQDITKNIIKHIKTITNNFTKTNQRICILIDRRWRINCEKFNAYKKLRDYKSISTYSETGWANGSWFTKDGYTANTYTTGNKDFYNSKYDTIYVYQPNLSQKKKK